MAVKRRKIDASQEKAILIGMITSTQFLRDVEEYYKPEYMEMEIAPQIASWCFRHFKRYGAAPCKAIQDIFGAWVRGKPDPEVKEYVEEFLEHISEEYEKAEEQNIPFLVDKTIRYFKFRSMKLLVQGIQDSLVHADDVEGAEELLNQYKKVEVVLSDDVDPFVDETAVHDAFNDTQDILFKVPGRLGELITPQLTRDSFIALLGPEKRGKTWWLMYLSLMAYRARKNVAFFSVGDMSKNQMLRRMGIFYAHKSDRPRYCKNVYAPILDCLKNQKNECTEQCDIGIKDSDGKIISFDDKDYTPCSECRDEKDFVGMTWKYRIPDVMPLTEREAFTALQKHKTTMKGKTFKLSTHSNRSLNVKGIIQKLDTWERTEGFIPDVIVIDYSDILKPEPESKGKATRDEQNETWMALRKLSQDTHCCVITATQAAATSYDKESIGRKDFSEDKRKFAHATAFFALNQTAEEKRMGMMRIAPLMLREDAFDEKENVKVAQSLETGRPCLFSF